MTTSISDQGIQFANNNIVGFAAAMPATGSYTAGDIVLQSSTTGEMAGWKRLTTGSAHVSGTDWQFFGPIGSGQTWQSVTRTSGTTYYNTTGKPIILRVSIQSSSANRGNADVSINGGAAIRIADCYAAASVDFGNGEIMIPVGASYVVTDGATTTRTSTFELR